MNVQTLVKKGFQYAGSYSKIRFSDNDLMKLKDLALEYPKIYFYTRPELFDRFVAILLAGSFKCIRGYKQDGVENTCIIAASTQVGKVNHEKVLKNW